MNTGDIIRAWKDELFRKSLSDEARAALPAHPAGEILLSEEEMASVLGGVGSEYCSVCCNSGLPSTCQSPCQPV
jgi:mersacidin/lichenicidin family type 2 lantibiotic